MKADLLVRSKWMVSREFGTLDIPKEPLVTIASVILPDPKEEKTRTKSRGVLTFKESFAKPLEMIATHLAALKLMFGDETDNWVDKQIKVGAIVGIYFKKRQTAVRILGSPQLKEAMSFSVRSFGGGSDNYSLRPITDAPPAAPASAQPKTNGHANGAAPRAPYAVGVVFWGKSNGAQIATLTGPELDTHIADYEKWLPGKAGPNADGTRANLAEMLDEKAHRVELEKQMDAGLPPPGAPPDASGPPS